MSNKIKNIISNHPRKNFILTVMAFFCGCLSAFSMAPANIWPILFIGLGGFYIILYYSFSRLMGFLIGWFFGFGYFLCGLSWIGNALLVEDNPYKWAWPLAVAGLPFLLSFFTGATGYLVKTFAKLQNITGFLLFAIIFILSEGFRGHVFSGFPWNLFGYTWANIPQINQNLAWGSIYSLTFFTILWVATPAFLIVSEHTKHLKTIIATISALSFLLCFGYGHFRLNNSKVASYPNYSVHVVQPNIPQNQKWAQNKMQENFIKRIKLSYPKSSEYQEALNTNDHTTLIIWPETALSPPFVHDQTYLSLIKQMLGAYPGNAYLISGYLKYNQTDKIYQNSMVLIDKNGQVLNTYDKHHLVPFGEYIPFGKYIPIKIINRFSGFKAGDSLKTVNIDEKFSYSPLICYESIFSGQVTLSGKNRPSALINISNDAWYGDSAGPHQHFVQARFRAIEEGLPLLRSASTGISAVTDPYGTVVSKTSILTDESFTSPIPNKLKTFWVTTSNRNIFFFFSALLFACCLFIFENKFAHILNNKK